MCMLGNIQQKKNIVLENIYRISSSPQVLCDELSMQSTIKNRTENRDPECYKYVQIKEPRTAQDTALENIDRNSFNVRY